MAVHLQGRVPAQEPGAAVRYLDRLADRPSERRVRGPDAAKPSFETPPAGGKACQAPTAVGGWPGRASFAPRSYGRWPTGASLDALLLLPISPGVGTPRGRGDLPAPFAIEQAAAFRPPPRAIGTQAEARVAGERGARDCL